jgi:hypothetical protein
VAGGERRDQAVLGDLLDGQVGRLDGRPDDADVERPRAQAGELCVDRELAQRQRDPGALRPEAPHRGGDEGHGGGLDEPERQVAGLAAGGAARRREPLLRLGERAAGVGEERGAGRGERHRPRAAGEQLGADHRLEPPHLLAQRRLGDADAFGGAAEVQLLGDGDEVAEVAKLGSHNQIL